MQFVEMFRDGCIQKSYTTAEIEAEIQSYSFKIISLINP